MSLSFGIGVCLATLIIAAQASSQSVELKELQRDVRVVEDDLLSHENVQKSRVDDLEDQFGKLRDNLTSRVEEISLVQGPRGDKGDTGEVGPPGINGTKGDLGDKGEIGQNGTKGEHGVKGDSGTQGLIGPPGPPGSHQMLSSLVDCNKTTEGQITYSMQSKSVYFCDGRVWVGLQPTISALGKSEGYPARSCHDLLSRTGALNESGIYWIKPSTEYSAFQTYCDMNGGWTLIMKMDGSQSTFAYASTFWTNKQTLNNDSLDMSATESKLATYWTLPLTELRLGMTVSGTTRWITVGVGSTAATLFSLIADGNYRNTSVGRDVWLSLIDGSALQENCNKEGFNAGVGNHCSVRIGIQGNNQNDCSSPDSCLGYGSNRSPSVGNTGKTGFGYVLAR